MRPLTSWSGVRASLGAFLVAFGRLGAPFAVWVLGGCFTKGRDSSVGGASDRRSEGPRFDPGSRQFWECVFALLCDFRRWVCMVSFVVAGFVSGTVGFSCFEHLACQAEFQFVCALCVCVVGVGVLLLEEQQQRSPTHRNHQWPRGQMDKASAHGAGDCRFESCRGHCLMQYGYLPITTQ